MSEPLNEILEGSHDVRHDHPAPLRLGGVGGAALLRDAVGDTVFFGTRERRIRAEVVWIVLVRNWTRELAARAEQAGG